MQIAVLHVKVCRQPRISSQFCIWVVTFAFYLDDIYGLKMIWTIFISEIDNSVLVLKTAIINIYYAIVFFFHGEFWTWRNPKKFRTCRLNNCWNSCGLIDYGVLEVVEANEFQCLSDPLFFLRKNKFK